MRIFTAMSLVLILFITTVASAAQSTPLNNISYQIRAQQWVKTSRATLTVSVNLTGPDQNIVSMKQSIMKNLGMIAAGDWHLINLNRSQTNSGLQSISAQAQIQLDVSQLSTVNQRAKEASRSGQTYRVRSINFQPELAERQATQESLRAEIYKKVQSELKILNAAYPKQQYFVHQIQFLGMGPVTRTAALMKMPGPASDNLSVSQRITMTANVTLSSAIVNET